MCQQNLFGLDVVTVFVFRGEVAGWFGKLCDKNRLGCSLEFPAVISWLAVLAFCLSSSFVPSAKKQKISATKLRWLKSNGSMSIACANPVLIVGRRASRQGRIPPSPLNLHLDPPPGSRSLLLGFRARRMFTRIKSSIQYRFESIHGCQTAKDDGG